MSNLSSSTDAPAWLRTALLVIAAVLAVLAIAFALRLPVAESLWPVAEGPTAFSFMAAILGGAAAPLLWIALAREWGAVAGYGFAFGVVTAGMGLSAVVMALLGGPARLLPFGIAMLVLALACFGAWRWGERQPLRDGRTTPRLLQMGFVVEIAVLVGVGALLLIRFPDILPWPIAPETSSLYAWVFLGLALYYAYALWRRSWHHARGPLLGFLVYDLMLIGPLLARIPTLEPRFVFGLVAAVGIIVISTLLAIWFLAVDPETRGWQPVGGVGERPAR